MNCLRLKMWLRLGPGLGQGEGVRMVNKGPHKDRRMCVEMCHKSVVKCEQGVKFQASNFRVCV